MKKLGSSITKDGIITHNFTDGERIYERNVLDITSLLEENKRKRNESNNGFTDDRGLRHIAELDMVTVHKLKVEHNIDVFNNDDMPRLKKWLKEHPAFMTVNGGI